MAPIHDAGLALELELEGENILTTAFPRAYIYYLELYNTTLVDLVVRHLFRTYYYPALLAEHKLKVSQIANKLPWRRR